MVVEALGEFQSFWACCELAVVVPLPVPCSALAHLLLGTLPCAGAGPTASRGAWLGGAGRGARGLGSHAEAEAGKTSPDWRFAG